MLYLAKIHFNNFSPSMDPAYADVTNKNGQHYRIEYNNMPYDDEVNNLDDFVIVSADSRYHVEKLLNTNYLSDLQTIFYIKQLAEVVDLSQLNSLISEKEEEYTEKVQEETKIDEFWRV